MGTVCSCNMATLSVDEQAVTYAALILHDAGLELNADNLNAITKAAGVSVASYWPSLFERALAGKDLDDFIMNAGAGAGPAPAAGGAAAGGAAAAAEPEPEEEEEEEESEDMGFDLFG